jgi:hypothetical protein
VRWALSLLLDDAGKRSRTDIHFSKVLSFRHIDLHAASRFGALDTFTTSRDNRVADIHFSKGAVF